MFLATRARHSRLTAGLAAIALIVFPQAGRAELADVLDEARQRLGPVLLARDVLVEPDKEVTLEASLRTGLRLTGIEAKRVQFALGDAVVGEARTNRAGDVALRWKAPVKPGNYFVTVRLNPQDQPEQPVEPVDLLVAVRQADTPLAIVDLDKTVVASGFAWVLLGGARPMAGASVVLDRLAKDHTIVYLTQRPDFLGTSSKKWLASNGFPVGPVLTSTLGTLLVGSGSYKSARLDALRETYKNIRVGIGDKFSDAKAYADAGMRSVLILHVNWAEDDPEYYEKTADELARLPESVQVVTNWSQVAAILFQGTTCPKGEMERRLRGLALDLRLRRKD